MGLYAKYIFPVLMDLVCSNRKIGEHRRELLQPIRGSILEIGFGTGINLEYYPDRVKAINVVEPNAGMEKRAAKRLKASSIQVGFHLGGAEKLPFENQIFDSVVSTFTLCSIPDVELALWEIHRVLKPAGRFYFLEHGLSEEPAVAERQIKLTPWQQRFADGCRLDRNMAKLVEGAGFRLLDLKKYYFRQSLKVFSFFIRVWRKNPEERAILSRLKIGILLVLVFCWGCGRNGQVDDVTQALALTVRTFINFFQDNLGNCDLFLQIYDELTETVQECDNPGEGTFQLTKVSVICENGPPLTATADFILDQTDCQDNGTKITSTGSMTMTLSFSAAGNIGILASTNLVAQDMTFVFDNFQTKVDLSNNNLSCGDSGDLTVDGSNCSVSSNCRQCNF